MGLMQLLNIVLFWIFFGSASAVLAKRKGRNPILWFFMGLFLGIFGVLLAVILPKPPQIKAPPPLVLAPPKRSESWLKMWYYLDPSHQKQGPFEFPDIVKLRQESKLPDVAYIWGEGMKEWKRLSELPELLTEIEQA